MIFYYVYTSMDAARALLDHERAPLMTLRHFPKGRGVAACFTYRGRVRPGLHRTIQKRWFSGFKRVKGGGGGGSSKAIGRQVDAQLQRYARTGRQPARANPFTKIAVDFLRTNNIDLVAGQVMVASESKGFATAIDLVGVRTRGVARPQLYLIEVKTGYARGATRAQGRLKAPLNQVPSTQQNHHTLQLLAMDELVRQEYGVCVHRAIVLYLQRDPKTKKLTASSRSYPEWCRTRAQRKRIWEAM